ncbi:intraflagellar transport protein 52 homolog [Toxorhynchites rutilus septentrionalis]|uniref:intraflagellar transport protein 52 homolog n=1 Tax=Toxorhynchites rutilus septentrionalis TaxID=329112 RepID=UPI002478BA21|nr:intraflagellar transport protein 52 homolog [Toxorhynchites rutilus septentrionalis]XP_055640544.1 intraflagellar transport protein 52 homolog [Toxorhynchites rutilus septentrionalis]
MNNVNVIFNVSKNELFKLPDNFKTLNRKLKVNYRVESNKNDITPEILKAATVFVLAGPQEKFTETEFQYLKDYLNEGGRLLLLLGEGGEVNFNTNINFLLEEYGMTINNDVVVRPQYYKYFHPKEALISGGIASDTMNNNVLEFSKSILTSFDFMDDKYKVEFVYPFGATMNIIQPSNVLLTTGPVVYPFNRPLAGFYRNESNGKLIAIGSGHMFHDKYISNEINMAIWDGFFGMILDDDFNFKSSDFNDLEINDYAIIPDTIYLAEQPKICLMDSLDYDIPADFKKLFDMTLYSINNDLLRDVINTYEKLDVQYETLKIIKPQFEIPLPPVQLAVFQPIFSDLAAPPLELFDLDEAFSSEKVQITQLTNKCLSPALEGYRKDGVDEKELGYFVQECGRILKVCQDDQRMSAKEILNVVCVKIAHYKKLDKE